jgi:Zn-finger nucleic acid-binding protein
MKCIQCGRRSTPNRSSCLYCGGEIDRSFDDKKIDCPGCETRMEKTEVSGVTIDICPSCHGSWFDLGELEQLLSRVDIFKQEEKEPEVRQSGSHTQRYRGCPRCASLMVIKNYKRYSGVLIDICRFHGIYLDSKELDRIATFVQNGGIEESRRRLNEEEKHAKEYTKPTHKHFLAKNVHIRRRRRYGDFFDWFALLF